MRPKTIRSAFSKGYSSAESSGSGSYDEENPPTNEHTPLYRRDESVGEHSVQSNLKEITALPGMKIRARKITKNGMFKKCGPSEALAGAKTGKKEYWVDIDAGPEDLSELRAWLHGLNLPIFVIDVLAASSDTWASQVVPLQRNCLAVLRILPESTTFDEMTHVSALALRNMLITFTTCPRNETGGLFSQALNYMNEPERLPRPSSAGALIAWFRFHLDRTSRSTRELRHAVLAMDESMDRDIMSVQIEEIIAAKDKLLHLMSVAEEQSECVQSFSAAAIGADGFDFPSMTGSLGSLVAMAGATERMTVRLEKHIADLRQRLEQHEHSVLNRRVGCLTALSAIFLPLTLLSSIWGMNFQQMPELSGPYSYPFALLFMCTVASSMAYYFRRHGWFD